MHLYIYIYINYYSNWVHCSFLSLKNVILFNLQNNYIQIISLRIIQTKSNTLSLNIFVYKKRINVFEDFFSTGRNVIISLKI